MLEAKNLSKTYKVKSKFFSKAIKEVRAVKDVSLTLKPGQIVGLIGINGAGKSTTIKMLSSQIEPTSGEITIDGLDGIKEHKKVKGIINVISGGERNIYWRLTARENLDYFSSLYGIKKKERIELVKELLEIVDLSESADETVEKFSKGMKQRLQIARGLINNPRYIFLDEPTLGLDIEIARDIRVYLKKLAKEKNKGLLITTHYIAEIEELCDWVYIIDKGKLIAEGTPKEITKSIQVMHEIEIVVINLSDNQRNALSHAIEDAGGQYTSKKSGIEETLLIQIKDDITSELLKIFDFKNSQVIKFLVKEPTLEKALLKMSDSIGGKL
ncbi:ABC transporter ATP-binding protein [Paenibacillus sp. NPDC058177]|uniref:ABC transporter ATP-binding protein n=1 Tax=Paenibacillus sp. NPDC058177 TaxID=3346369 RepID=UPI0036DB4BEB